MGGSGEGGEGKGVLEGNGGRKGLQNEDRRDRSEREREEREGEGKVKREGRHRRENGGRKHWPGQIGLIATLGLTGLSWSWPGTPHKFYFPFFSRIP